MNKRIKKKKVKQALQHEQEFLEQEFSKSTPSERKELIEAISQVIMGFNQAIIEVSEALASSILAIGKVLEGIIEKIEQQRITDSGPGAVQISRHPAYH